MDFLALFNKEYDKLYNSEEYERKNYHLADKFDKRLNSDEVFRSFVEDLYAIRHDFITSDREAMAFMLALREYIKEMF